MQTAVLRDKARCMGISAIRIRKLDASICHRRLGHTARVHFENMDSSDARVSRSGIERKHRILIAGAAQFGHNDRNAVASRVTRAGNVSAQTLLGRRWRRPWSN